MDINNIGKLLKKLRHENKWSQQELADKIPISRESISKWEKGKNIPDYQSLIRLSEIFNVSIDELLIGEKIEKKDKSIFVKKILQLYEEKNKLKRRIIQVSFLVIILVFSFLSYYFFNSYNSIKIYSINYDDSYISIKNGIFITTEKKIYFNLGNISYKGDQKIIYSKLYFKNSNNKEQLILGLTNGDFVIIENFGYDEYFDCDELDYITENLFFDVEFEEENKVIKLELEEVFSNDSLFFKKEHSI